MAASPANADTGEVDVAVPGFGQQDDAEQRQGWPDERPCAVAAHRGDGQRTEELDRDGGAERDAFDGGEESDGHQSGGDAQPQKHGDVAAA